MFGNSAWVVRESSTLPHLRVHYSSAGKATLKGEEDVLDPSQPLAWHGCAKIKKQVHGLGI